MTAHFPLIADLRQATADRHSAIEAVLGLDAPFDLDTYTRMLAGFDAFLRAWEPAMQLVLPPGMQPWFTARCRGAMAQADLRVLGVARADPAVVRLPAMHNLSAALGSLYVMEGSALGGQVIAKQVASQHGLSILQGASYFNGWGARTGAMWREFQQVLQDHETQGADRRAACDSAVATFDALIAHFREVRPAAGHAAEPTIVV